MQMSSAIQGQHNLRSLTMRKHLVTRCRIFRTRSVENEDDRSFWLTDFSFRFAIFEFQQCSSFSNHTFQQGGIPPIRVNAQRRGSDKVLISRLITWTYLPSWTFAKLWPFGVSAISDACPMSFRQPPVLDPMNFDDFRFRSVTFSINFRFTSVGFSNSPLTNY